MCAVPESSTHPHSDSVHPLGAFRKPARKFSGLYCCIGDDEGGPDSCCGYATKLGVGKVLEAGFDRRSWSPRHGWRGGENVCKRQPSGPQTGHWGTHAAHAEPSRHGHDTYDMIG
jgi:hypothetical protein